MVYRKTSQGVEIPSSLDLDLLQTLDCGQCFRWQVLPGGEYRGIACGRTLTITEKNGTVLFCGVTAAEFETIWVPYFDLDFDYAAVRESLAQMHPALRQAAEFAPGIRLLRQDPWEALCSFILSQNNNIPRIKGLVDRLCRLLGEERGGFYDFPPPERLAVQTVDSLAPVRSGFRAKYLIDAARKVAGGEVDLDALSRLPIDEARQSLMGKGGGVRPAVRPAPARGVPHGCVDEARHGGAAARLYSAPAWAVCGRGAAVSVSLQPVPCAAVLCLNGTKISWKIL